MEESNPINFEESLGSLLKNSVSGSGEEELLRIASRYSLQISAYQIKALLLMGYMARRWRRAGYLDDAGILDWLAERWLFLKENNHSDLFIMKALEFISLRKFLNENTFKVNIDK